MKKLIVAALCLSMLALTACGLLNCKADGCDLDVYKSGYCEIHYAAQALKGLFS